MAFKGHIPWNKGLKGKQVAWNKGIIGVFKRTEETKLKMRLSHLGEKHSPERRKKMSDSRIGKPILSIRGDKNSKWKGDKVGYRALHSWVRRTLGKPTKCSNCDVSDTQGYRIVWANKSGQYQRETDDWINLCCYCHHSYDHKRKLPMFS